MSGLKRKKKSLKKKDHTILKDPCTSLKILIAVMEDYFQDLNSPEIKPISTTGATYRMRRFNEELCQDTQ